MTRKWIIGAQVSTSHSPLAAIDPIEMREKVERVRDAIDLDLLIVGFREQPEAFAALCGRGRPVDDVYLWYNALSDIEGMAESDLVVNWLGEKSRGWGGWAEKGAEVAETFRFACPNNPAVREKTKRRLRELLTRYDFEGVFLDKIRFPSPANGVDEMLSCFCEHCRRVARARGFDLDAVAGIFAEGAWRANFPAVDGDRSSHWLDRAVNQNPLLARFLAFRAESVAKIVAELAEEARRLGRKVGLDLFSPCLAPLVGQDYARLKQDCEWAKPMTYRLALGPAGLRLEIPALIEGVAQRLRVGEARVAEWSARHAGFDRDMLRQTRDRAVPLAFIQSEIEAAVRAMAPVPVYFGLELVSQPGVIDVTPSDVIGMAEAGRAAKTAGLVISWDLMHAPMDSVRALANATRA